jgi:hypothetical protein
MFTYSSEARMQELITKANKALGKLDLGSITVISVEPRKVADGLDALGYLRYRTVYDAELAIPAALVQIADQKVVARLEDVDGMNMITRLTDDEGINLDCFREIPITCAHCGLKRTRKASWVVQMPAGSLIQVGDTCATLYFGIDVTALLATADKVYRLLDCDEEFEGGSRRNNNFSFSMFTSVVIWQTMTSGFVTRKQAGDYGVSTADLAEGMATNPGMLSGKALEDHQKRCAAFRAWREDHFKGLDLLSLAMDWWMERDNLYEFEHNCRLGILSQDPRFLGLAAFGLKIWATEVFGHKASTESSWVGEVKQRITVDAKVITLGSFEGYYGTITVVTFEDAAGNILVWKATCDPKVTLGQECKVTGTIIKHGEYKGVKQTELKRCTIATPTTKEPS